MMWDRNRFIDVGISGTQIRLAAPDDDVEPDKPAKGPCGRPEQHRSSARRGDRLCIHVCDQLR